MVNNNKHISYLVTKLTRNKGKKKRSVYRKSSKTKGFNKEKVGTGQWAVETKCKIWKSNNELVNQFVDAT